MAGHCSVREVWRSFSAARDGRPVADLVDYMKGRPVQAIVQPPEKIDLATEGDR